MSRHIQSSKHVFNPGDITFDGFHGLDQFVNVTGRFFHQDMHVFTVADDSCAECFFGVNVIHQAQLAIHVFETCQDLFATMFQGD